VFTEGGLITGYIKGNIRSYDRAS